MPSVEPGNRRFQLVLAFALLVALPGIGFAQDRPAPVAEIAAGWVGFVDDGIADELMAGGAARWYLTQRLSIGPEVIYITGSDHNHLMITGNATFDLVRRAITPFLVIGGGLFQTREDFRTQTFRSSEGAFTLGGGVRIAAGDRVTIGIDTRVGWETHVRLNGVVGIRLF